MKYFFETTNLLVPSQSKGDWVEVFIAIGSSESECFELGGLNKHQDTLSITFLVLTEKKYNGFLK